MDRQTPPAASRVRRGLRPLVTAGIACVTLALMVDAWLVEGLLRPVVVASGSMAPALLGPHLLFSCTGCHREFVCADEPLPAAGRAVCPYCHAANESDAGQACPGDRVLIDRSAFLWRSPRRWEVVALNSSDEPHTRCVKRVVALPGEEVQIVDGDVWINGQIARKTLAELRGMAVAVDDGTWHDPRGHWQRGDDHYAHRPTTKAPDEIHWLAYHHSGVHSPGNANRAEPNRDEPILDASSYDQNESRVLNPISDILLSCQLAASGSGEVLLTARVRGETFLIRYQVESATGTLARDEAVVASFAAGPGRAMRLEWLLADHQVQLALDGRLAVDYPYEPLSETSSGVQGVAIGARGARVELGDLRLRRDLFYSETPDATTQVQPKFRLRPDEYFVLGDNSPHSLDSRIWSKLDSRIGPKRGGISSTAIVGRVVRW